MRPFSMAAGIPAICFGPGDIALAHAAEEFVPIEEIGRKRLHGADSQWCEEVAGRETLKRS